MCLAPILCSIEFLPYICLVTIPLFGAFCGNDIILRLSVLLYVHSLVIDFLQKISLPILPLIQLLVLGGLACFPVSLTPTPVIWIYDKLLWVTEPALLLAEAMLALNFIMRCSQRVMEKMEDEDEAWKWKVLLTLFSALCYGLTSSIVLEVYQSGTTVQTWLLLLVVVMVLAIHNMMWLSHEGVVCDAAFCSLCSVAIFYAMVLETSYIRSPLAVPATWKGTYKQSFLRVFASIFQVDAELAGRAVQLLQRFLSAFFLVSLGIRLYSILFITDKVTQHFFQDEEDFMLEDDDFDDEKLLDPMLPWRSPLLLKVAVIFMVTQLAHLWLSEVSGSLATRLGSLPLIQTLWPREILIGRVFQLLVVNGFYMWRLYRADDWTWSKWLTS